MTKIFILIFLLSPGIIISNNWYVSTSSSGNASGSSWANKRMLSSFNWNAVLPGDTVFIDGGTDNLTYNYTLVPTKSGTANNRITISRGKDSGHNGRVIFIGADDRNAANISVDFIELNNLVFKNGGINGGCVLGIIDGAEGVNIINCEIWHPRTIGVIIEANNTRFIGNTVLTGTVSNNYGTDGMWIGGGGEVNEYGNIEIAYNYFLNQNYGGVGHKDALQFTSYWQKNDGLSKIHHNFFAVLPISPSTNANLLYVDDGAAGHYEVYDNIFVQKNCTDQGYVNYFRDYFDFGIWAKVYNNTVYNTTIGCVSWKFNNVDSLDFRNNIIYAPNCWVVVGIDYYTEILGAYTYLDYNQYQVQSTNNFAYMQEIWEPEANHPLGDPETISWNQWKTRMSADYNSQITTFSFFGGSEFSPSTYKLNSSSSGIDEGTTLTLFSNDFESTPRPQGSVWDVGAFEYFETSSGLFQLVVETNDGWNMVSIPGNHPDGNTINNWWADRVPFAPVYEFIPPFTGATTLASGKGYWMKQPEAQLYQTGDEWPASGIITVPHDAINANAGWNLIGGYEHNAAVSGITTTPPGLQDSPVYGYSGGYQMVDYLIPGYGYWIKLSDNGLINLPNQVFKGLSEVTEYIKEEWGKIIIIDADGRSYTLFGTEGEVDLNQYDLPPVPPTGMFDIRFSSGRIAEDLNSAIKTIEMSGIKYPITVRAEGMDIRLMDETGKTINVNLKSGEDVVISDATIQKLMVTGELIPTVYALEQNYPNPFNPSTTIRFFLPQAKQIKINLYNMIGEQIATLAEGMYEPGNHNVTFKARNLSSGTYIYQIVAGDFVQTKKMVLLK